MTPRPVKRDRAVVVTLSAYVRAVIADRGSVMLIRGREPVFTLSDQEAKRFHAVYAEFLDPESEPPR